MVVVAKNGMLLDNEDVETIKFLRHIFITDCNLEDRKFAIMLLRIGRAPDLPKAMDLAQRIKQTFTWIN